MPRHFWAISMLAVAWVGTAAAQEPTTDEIARELSNPTSALMSLNSQIDYRSFKGTLPGASDQSAWTYLFQPVFPFPQASGANILFRPAIPVLFNQPVFTGTAFESAGVNLGNINFDLMYGKTTASGMLLGVGVVGTLPTATDPALRANWAFGPEVILGIIRSWGVVGVLVTQSFDVSGSTKSKTLGGQYFVALSLGGGWQLASSPPFSYDWDSKDLTFPVGGGPFKTVVLGSTPLKLGAQVWYFVSQADAFGPEWQVRVSISPVIKAPW